MFKSSLLQERCEPLAVTAGLLFLGYLATLPIMMSEDLQLINARNARVEADKAWETSKTRRVCIAGMTYIIASAYMAFLGIPDFYLHALVPTGGYLLSTLTLGFIKLRWLKKYVNL